MPNKPALIGGALYFQAIFLDPGATSSLSMSRGQALWIG